MRKMRKTRSASAGVEALLGDREGARAEAEATLELRSSLAEAGAQAAKRETNSSPPAVLASAQLSAKGSPLRKMS
jgi:hypothetical protein